MEVSKERLHIVKIGGGLVDNRELLERFLVSFSSIQEKKILVHGGGKMATRLSQKLGIASNMIDGRRVTDTQTLDIVVMVYAGLVNKSVVALLQAVGENALGFTGADANLIQAVKRPVGDIDYGWVGDITAIENDLLISLIRQQCVPVIAPITHDGEGQLLNTNADTIASRLAISLCSDFEVELSYCFEYPGVLADPDSSLTETFPRLGPTRYSHLKENGMIHSGMIPKLDNGFDAVSNEVGKVYICGIENLNCKTNATQILAE